MNKTASEMNTWLEAHCVGGRESALMGDGAEPETDLLVYQTNIGPVVVRDGRRRMARWNMAPDGEDKAGRYHGTDRNREDGRYAAHSRCRGDQATSFGGDIVIVRDVINTRPPDQLAAWFDGLGAFEMLTPSDAAERWGLPIRDAMERLHAMVGGPLEIPPGQIERYQRIPWSCEPARESSRLPGSRDERRAERVAMMPAEGARRCDLMRLWGVSEKTIDKVLTSMTNRKLIKREGKIWRRI